jgi:hypothetical protein
LSPVSPQLSLTPTSFHNNISQTLRTQIYILSFYAAYMRTRVL